MNEFNFTPADLEHFMSRGFEVYKSNNGRFYIKPTIINTHTRLEEAIHNAKIAGLEISTNLEVLNYTRKWKY